MKIPRGSQHPLGSVSRKPFDLRTLPLDVPTSVAPVDAVDAYRVLHPRLVHAAAGAADGAVMVGVVDPRHELVSAALLGPGGSLVIGRHSQCGVRLAAADVSLRHLALLVGDVTSEGLPSLRLWDLATGKPFVAEDGVRTEAIASEGPLFASLGQYAIAVVPLSESGRAAGDADDDWLALPRREFVTRLAEGTTTRRLIGRDPHTSRVTHLGSTCELDELDDPACAVAELVIDCSGRRRRYYLDPSQLERGVLVGRYSRCCNDVIDDRAVSRVHVLIAAAGSACYAIDTASTSGTASPAGAFDVLELGSETVLALGDDTLVYWKRYPVRRA